MRTVGSIRGEKVQVRWHDPRGSPQTDWVHEGQIIPKKCGCAWNDETLLSRGTDIGTVIMDTVDRRVANSVIRLIARPYARSLSQRART
jgi:hypothetical protein